MADKITLTSLLQRKQQGQPVAMLTCYDYATAVLLQEAKIDSILVGDTLAEMVLGHDTTLSATMEMMIALTAAVRRGAPNVYLLGDMPFLSYQVSREQAIFNAGRFLSEAGCDGVKLEVDRRHVDLVAAMTAANIPVIAHLGLRPQAIHQLGGFKAQGQTAAAAEEIMEDARRMLAVGVCGLLLECVTAEVGRAVSAMTELPVISCGSGPYCDGQVMVLHDILGLPGAGQARFAKTYAPIGEQIVTAVRSYIQQIHERQFPDAQHSYHMKEDEKQRFEKGLENNR